MDMCGAIATARRQGVRVVAYVNGRDKGAYSAGALICLACEAVVMSPGSVMGAAAPVLMDSQGGIHDMGGDMRAKTVSAFSAKFRALAADSGFPPALAAAMVDRDLGVVMMTKNGKPYFASMADAKSLRAQLTAEDGRAPTEKIICQPGALVTVTADEALQMKALKGLADTPEELIQLLGVSGKPTMIYDPMDKFWLRLKPVQARIKEMGQQFEKAWDDAVQAAPGRGNYTYYQQTGKFTPESQREWRKRTDNCVAYIDQCIRILNEMQALMKVNSDLFSEDDAGPLKEIQSSLEQDRKRIVSERDMVVVRTPR